MGDPLKWPPPGQFVFSVGAGTFPPPVPAASAAMFPLQALLDRPQVGTPLGAHVMASLPLLDRVRLRALSRGMRSSIDASFLSLESLTEHDLAGLPGADKGHWPEALLWLVSKCRNLVTLSMDLGMTAGGGLSIELPDASSDGVGGSVGGGNGSRSNETPWWEAAGTDASFMVELALSCRRLRTLTLKKCVGVTDAGIRALAVGCPDLRSVNVKGCTAVTDQGVKWLARNCPRLEALNVGFTGLVTDAGLIELARGCPGMTELTLTYKQGVTDKGIRAVAERCGRLRRLKVRQCHKVTDGGIAAVAFACKELSYLNVGGGPVVTDISITMVASSCPGLESLLVGGSGVTHAGIAAVIQSCQGLRRLRARDNGNVKDRTVELLARRCPGLRQLDLAQCDGVTDASLALVAECCPLLEELVLEKCRGVTAASVIAVGERCPRLQVVNLNHCGGATDASLAVIAHNCPDIMSLRVSSCDISDGTLVTFAERGKLRELDVSGCGALTVDSFRALATRCAGIRFMVATGVKVAKSELGALLPCCEVDCSRYWFVY